MPLWLALVTTVALAAPQAAVRGAGTYHVVICSSPCTVRDTNLALFAGIAVLDTALARPGPHGAGVREGCLELHPETSSVLRIMYRSGFTSWSVQSDSLSFYTAWHPDASNQVLAVLS